MIRKLVLALGATAAVAAAALTPTTASAWSHNHGSWGHRWHGGYGYYGPTYIASPDCYVVKKVVYTDFGPRVRRVTVCD
jgi:hypothetical protein